MENKKAREYFTKEWGTGFYKASLQEKNGIVQLSMEDIYRTMESYKDQEIKKLLDEFDSRYNQGFYNGIKKTMEKLKDRI